MLAENTYPQHLHVRSVMPRGNGASIVHNELVQGLPFYLLRDCSPYLASLPGLPSGPLREWLAGAPIVHLPADLGHVPLAGTHRRVITLHNFYTDPENLSRASTAQKIFYQLMLSRAVAAATCSADRIVVVSRFLADCVRNWLPDAAGIPVDVIYNGIDTNRFQPCENANTDRPLRVLFVGNPSRRKGFDLVKAIAEKLPSGVELAFTAGLRGEQVRIRGGQLVPLGRIPYAQMHLAYHQADVLLFPTYREGFGLCVAEAMACGLPVVSTICSAIPELIDEARGGYLVRPGDIESMVERTMRLLQNPSLRCDMGAWNRERAVRDFDRTRMLNDYQNLFSGLNC